jgi:hypothetical protein
MRSLLVFGMILAICTSCNKRKYAAATEYNDKVVGFVEQSERAMKVWNTTNFMQEYMLKKHNTVMRLLNMQDSLANVEALTGDDTLRQAAMIMVENYIESFVVYDTIYAILSDSVYYPEDSIRVKELLSSNQNMLETQASSFMEAQKRFAARYDLPFVE